MVPNSQNLQRSNPEGGSDVTTLDHLYGMKVIDVLPGEAPEWSIRFDGGFILTNKSEQYPVPPAVNGAVFQRASFSDEATVLSFDNGAFFALDPTEYTITDREDVVTYPQRPQEVESYLPDDPARERVVEGPEPQIEDAPIEEVDNASDQDN